MRAWIISTTRSARRRLVAKSADYGLDIAHKQSDQERYSVNTFSADPSPDKPLKNMYLGETPVDAVYRGDKLLWPRDDFEVGASSLSDLMQSNPHQCLTAHEFAALECRDSDVLYIVLGSLPTGSAPERHRLQ